MLNVTVREGLPQSRYEAYGLTARSTYVVINLHRGYRRTDGKGNFIGEEELLVKILNDRHQTVEVPCDLFVECPIIRDLPEKHFSGLPKVHLK